MIEPPLKIVNETHCLGYGNTDIHPCRTFGPYSEKYPLFVALEGVVDNLQEIVASMGLKNERLEEAVAELYARFGSDAIFRVKGTVCIILHDTRKDVTLLYRPYLNGLPLYYHHDRSGLSAASNPLSLYAAVGKSPMPDEHALAMLFRATPTEIGSNFYRDIDIVGHGEMIIIENGRLRSERRMETEAPDEPRNVDDQSVYDRFRKLLTNSIATKAPDDRSYGIMLSSGLDSASIAALGKRVIEKNGGELTAYSWHFSNGAIDESEHVQKICDYLCIPLKQFDGDEYAPFDDLDRLPFIPDTPFLNIFWRLNSECYRRAGADGIAKVFNGNYGDLMFSGRNRRLSAVLRDDRYDLLLSIASEEIGSLPRGLYRKMRKRFAHQEQRPMPWLAETGSVFYPTFADNTIPLAYTDYHMGYLGWERYLSAPYGVERLEPHKDAELLTFTLHLPSYMNDRKGVKKHFVREAMRGLLPESVLAQNKVALLQPFVRESFLRNLPAVREYVLDHSSAWKPYVDRVWMEKTLGNGMAADHMDIHIVWQCIALSGWLDHVRHNTPSIA